MAITQSTEANANRTRWGAGLLTLGILISIVGVTMALTMAVGPSFGATAAERAQYVANNATTYEVTGWLYLYASLLVAAGAFFLVTRALDSGFPGSAFWLLIGISQILYVITAAIRTGALIPIARDFANNATLYEAITNFTRVVGNMALIAVAIGAIGIFWAEARAGNAVIPAWLAYAGVGAALVRVVAMGLTYAEGEAAFYTARSLTYVGYFVMAAAVLVLAARLAWPNVALMGTTATRTERA